VHGDIDDSDLVADLIATHDIDTIVHLAAESHVDRSIEASRVFLTTNVLGTHTLLHAARARWESLGVAARNKFRFHHVSTDEVYGSLSESDPAFTETTAYAPNSPYAASKAASDHLVRAWHRTYGLPVTITNCSNNYGPYQFPEKLIPLLLTNALDGRALPVYGDGMNRRDWLYVTDHCRGIELAIEKGRTGECYNIGGGEELPNLELVRILCDRIDVLFAARADLRTRFPNSAASKGRRTFDTVEMVTDRKGHDRRYAIDSTRAATELGYTAREALNTGLDATIDWYLTNETWWRPLIKK
jgi:dTDP-glucose 4,6-dehydratase